MTTKKQLIQLESVNVTLGGKKILSDINFDISTNEHWAIIGGNGAGKSTLLKLIRGDIWPDVMNKGKRFYHFDGEKQSSPIGVKEKIRLVSAENQDAYVKYGCFLTGEEVVHTGFFDSAWLQQKPDENQIQITNHIFGILKIEHLSSIKFQEMSRGDARKILVARAIVNKPSILILDEFCNGLDKESSKHLLKFVDYVVSHNVQILLTTHRMHEIIPSISHAILIKDGKIISIGKRDDVLTKPNLSIVFSRTTLSNKTNVLKTKLDLKEETALEINKKSIISIKNVDIFIKEKKILSQINWEMHSNENWLILGNNGAGKSTFLNLIIGDLVPALGGEIIRFGKKEIQNIWDIKKRIGYVSANLQTNYSFNLSGEKVVQSGFNSSIGIWEELTNQQKEIATNWINFFSLQELAKAEFQTMSYGESRKILIVRAMVNNPDILVLDEPCDGLDIPSRNNFLKAIEKLCNSNTKIIYATHHTDEIISQINRTLILENGKILAQGNTKEVLDSAFTI